MFAEKEARPQHKSSTGQHPVQTKLEIGAKDDPQEKEADEVARKVMRKGEPGAAAAGAGVGMIHRMHDDEDKVMPMHDEAESVMPMKDESEEKVHKMHDEEEGKVMTMKDTAVQPKTDKPLMMQADPAGGGGGTATPAFQQQLNSTKGSGDPLPGNIQRDFAASTGNDLSGVKVHTDSNAHEMSAGINAKAFTHGQDIYFKQGQYNPTSDSGKELIYHEAQHTVQQGGGVQRKVQRGFWGSVWGGIKATGNFLYENTGLKTVVETGKDIYHWAADSPEEFQKYMQAKLKGQIDELKAAKTPSVKFMVNYWAMKGIAIAMNPMALFMMPSAQALWDIYVQGKLGYYTYLYNLGNEYVDRENSLTGKKERVKNENYKKGGYAAVFSNQMKNMFDPRFIVGEVVGIFKGIGNWFVDLWDMVVFLGEAIWGGITSTWNMLVFQEPPKWMTSIAKGAESAGAWFQQNGKIVMEEFGELIRDPEKLKQTIRDLKDAIKTGAGHLAWAAGEGFAALQVKIMSMSAYEQGEMFGKAIGYLIPEIVIAVFTDTIVNWIKGGVKAVQVFGKALKGFKAISKLGEAASGVARAFEKIGVVFKRMGKKIGGKLGEMFDKIMDFFKGITKWGDEVPTNKLDDLPGGNKHLPDEHLPDGKKPKVDEPDPHKKPKEEPDGDDMLRRMAYAAVIEEVVQSNQTDEPLSIFEEDIYAIKSAFPIIKQVKFRQGPDGGEFVMIKASPWKTLGYKKKPKKKNKDKKSKYSGRRPKKPQKPVLDKNGKLTEYGEWYYDRPKFKKGVRKKAWDMNKRKNGSVYDVKTKKRMNYNEPWDMGHKPGYEFWKERLHAAKKKMGIDEFRSRYNDVNRYRPELPSSNRSHSLEAADDIFFD